MHKPQKPRVGPPAAPSRGAVEPERRLVRKAERLLETAGRVEARVEAGEPADRALSALFRANPGFGSRDRRLYGEAVFALFRWRGWSGSLRSEGPRALLFAHLLDTPEPDPAVLRLPGLQGPGTTPPPLPAGAGLPEKAAAAAAWRGRPAPLPLEALVPAWVPGMLGGPCSGAAGTARCLAAFQARPPLWLRARGPGAAVRLAEALAAGGIPAGPHPALPDAVRVEGRPHLPELEKRTGPCFEVQDLGAQAVGIVCAPRPGERWWDACAGGGGKTLHLADLAGGDLRLLATDPRPAALLELARRARRAGRDRAVQARPGDAAANGPGAGTCDGALVDAPCSGLGTWPRNPDARWRTGPEAVARAAAAQAALLDAAAAAVRPGGRLVYAVCTLTRAETDGQADRFLASHPAFTPEPCPHPLGSGPAAGRHWIPPWLGPGTGMFIARFRRAG